MNSVTSSHDHAASSPKTRIERDSDRVYLLRRCLIGFLAIIVYVLLDRSTVFFQMWSGISAWYPPVGLSLALLIGMGTRYAPLLLLSGLIAAKLNYHDVGMDGYVVKPVTAQAIREEINRVLSSLAPANKV